MLCLLTIALLHAGSGVAIPKPDGPLKPIDLRKRDLLKATDKGRRTGGQDNNYPTPNLRLKSNYAGPIL